MFCFTQNKYSIKNILLENDYDLESFFVGATLNHNQLNSNIEKLFLDEFNYSTPENCAKQTQIHPEPGIWRWSKLEDYLTFANTNDIKLRIHGPISPQASWWAKNDSRTKQELLTNLNEFFTALCIKINENSSVKWMDVVNETVTPQGEWFKEKKGFKKWENPWTQIGLNEDGIPLYIIRAFEIANEYAPNISLVYNQHGGMQPKMWKRVLETILYLREKGLRVDGLGWQAHLKDTENIAFDLDQLNFFASLVDWCHKNNLEFHITEIDYRITNENPTTKDLQRQAVAYSNIMKVLISRRETGIITFNTWGMVDRPGKHTDSNRFLYDNSLNPKPALYALKKALIDKNTSIILE